MECEIRCEGEIIARDWSILFYDIYENSYFFLGFTSRMTRSLTWSNRNIYSCQSSRHELNGHLTFSSLLHTYESTSNFATEIRIQSDIGRFITN